ncbi:MAG: hypothetical protein Tp1100MES1331091_51 [Prokaryotic dsDNA virus sp.]|nr:MAG: hypothetical protein Tp1100MES1331091_51 [Prokaryotic dsDNA virus sp.]|tara:strand:+ start:2516 stop:2830 length:315 start_codon:yes stop_codon:yes gene_type:complete
MTTKKKSIDETYDGNSEASRAHGVRPKGSKKPPPNGKVTVVHKRKGLGLSLLDKAQLMYMTAAGIFGEYMIFTELAEPYRAHAMWAFGIATIVCAIPCFFRKRE